MFGKEPRGASAWRNLDVPYEGRLLSNFCSLDIFGLASHRDVVRASQEAVQSFGIQSAAPVAAGGNSQLYEALCVALANHVGMEAAIVLPSRTQAWLTLLSNIVDESDLLLADEKLGLGVVADAAELTRCKIQVFDPDSVQTQSNGVDFKSRPSAICLQAVCRATGRVAQIDSLIQKAELSGVWILCDESLSIGVIGKRGAGVLSLLPGDKSRRAIVSELGSVVPGGGAFIAGSHYLIDFLKERSQVLRTEPAPAVPTMATTLEALLVLSREQAFFSRELFRLATIKSSLVSSPLLDSFSFPILGRSCVSLDVAKEVVNQAMRGSGIALGIEEIRSMGVCNKWYVRGVLNIMHAENEISTLRDIF